MPAVCLTLFEFIVKGHLQGDEYYPPFPDTEAKAHS